MRKIGMYGGKFIPLHKGHVKCIIEASTMVDELYVVLCYNEKKERPLFKDAKIDYVDYKTRYRWLCQLTKHLPHVKIVAMEDDYDWHNGARNIKKLIGFPIHTVFFGGDYEYDIWKEIYPEAKSFYKFLRTSEDISATKIRTEGAFKYWDMIPNVCKSHYVKKIAIVGSESCGKSTLTANLAAIYNTNYVHEYGRDVCEEAGGEININVNDFKKILCGQVMLEEEAIKNSNKLLFIDSEQIVTNYYLNFLDCNKYTVNDYIQASLLCQSISKLQKYDLVFLMAPTVKWVDDGTRIHGEQSEREMNHEILRDMYKKAGIKVIEINESSYHNRLNKIKEYIGESYEFI